MLLEHLVAGHSREEPPKLLLVGEVDGIAGAAPGKEALPDRLHEVHRIKLVPQDPREANPDHRPNFPFIPLEQVANRGIVASTSATHQLAKFRIVQLRLLRRSERTGGSSHAGLNVGMRGISSRSHHRDPDKIRSQSSGTNGSLPHESESVGSVIIMDFREDH